MNKFRGSRVFEGFGLGKLLVFKQVSVQKQDGLGEEKEFERFDKARTETIKALNNSYLDTLAKLGEKEAQLFETHKLMAEDLDFEDAVRAELAGNVTAEYAVQSAGQMLAEMFASMDDAYMKERANDVREVAARIVSCLRKDVKGFQLTEPSIIICDDLPSSELMKLDKDLILGLVFVKGGSNSHVSILTRMLEIPALCSVEGLEVTDDLDGQFAILDASSSELLLNVSMDDIHKYTKLKK